VYVCVCEMYLTWVLVIKYININMYLKCNMHRVRESVARAAYSKPDAQCSVHSIYNYHLSGLAHFECFVHVNYVKPYLANLHVPPSVNPLTPNDL
jgi:hypothetical protein